MKPYPRNDIDYKIVTPTYENGTSVVTSRYSVYRRITNLPFEALEIKLTNSISKNSTYRGYYYTTTKKETVYEIAKKYYNDEQYYWILCKANNLKNDNSTIIDKGVTLNIPAFSELTAAGGYFSTITQNSR